MAQAVRPTVKPRTHRGYNYVSRAAGKRMLDEQAQKYLGLSGEEFAQRYSNGMPIEGDESAIVRVSMLLPFAERARIGRKKS